MDNVDLVVKNMPLVYYIIKHDYPRYIGDEDILQCGLLGLTLAAKRYDPSKGKFSSYARKDIHGEINREIQRRNIDKITVSLDQMQEIGERLW